MVSVCNLIQLCSSNPAVIFFHICDKFIKVIHLLMLLSNYDLIPWYFQSSFSNQLKNQLIQQSAINWKFSEKALNFLGNIQHDLPLLPSCNFSSIVIYDRIALVFLLSLKPCFLWQLSSAHPPDVNMPTEHTL